MKHWSISWKRSVKARKQRKFRFNAPLHIKKDFLHSHLATDLRKKHGIRSIGVRKGDKVKIMRGQYKGQSGKVERVDVKREKIYVNGIELHKKDGSVIKISIHPSNLLIQEMKLDDKKRNKILERKKVK